MKERPRNEYNIDLIRRHGSGWEDEWNRIVVDLTGALFDNENAGPLARQCHRVCRSSKEKNLDPLEFFNWVITRYYDRVNAPDLDQDGRPSGEKSRYRPLFEKFDPSQGDVISFLCSPNKLRLDLNDFLRESRMNAITGYFENEDGEIWEPEDPSSREGITGESESSQQAAERMLYEVWSDLIPKMYDQRGRDGETAGLELYPGLVARSEEAGAFRLLGLVREAVAKGKDVSGDEPDRLLREEHLRAGQQFEEDRQTLQIRMNQCLEVNLTYQKYEAKLQKLLWLNWFCPISASPMDELFGISHHSAYRYIHRYQTTVQERLTPPDDFLFS